MSTDTHHRVQCLFWTNLQHVSRIICLKTPEGSLRISKGPFCSKCDCFDALRFSEKRCICIEGSRRLNYLRHRKKYVVLLIASIIYCLRAFTANSDNLSLILKEPVSLAREVAVLQDQSDYKVRCAKAEQGLCGE